jgi:hypothetical protein
MPQQWSAQRERQYAYIKDGLTSRGRAEDVAAEIAARTVNKEKARSGESCVSSATSTRDVSSGRRGGLGSYSGTRGRTKPQLYQEARRKKIRGRSRVTRDELVRAIGERG